MRLRELRDKNERLGNASENKAVYVAALVYRATVIDLDALIAAAEKPEE